MVGVSAVAGWWRLGTSPQLIPGSFTQEYDLTAIGDGFAQTRYLVPPGGNRFAFSVRNDGAVSVQISKPPAEDYAFSDVVGFQSVGAPPDGFFDPDAALVGVVTIAPDEEATAVVDFAPPPCIEITTGGSVGLESLAVRVRSLGLMSDQEVALPLPVYVPGPVVPAPGC